MTLDQEYFFLTARVYRGYLYFQSNKNKELLFNTIRQGCEKFDIRLLAWAIIDNHHHLLIRIQGKNSISGLIKFINGKSSYLLNKLENKKGRRVWYQYFDKIIDNKKDFYRRLNYIHQNPIKHNLVKNLKELEKYQFCSYNNYLRQFGQEWLDECFRHYPVISFVKD